MAVQTFELTSDCVEQNSLCGVAAEGVCLSLHPLDPGRLLYLHPIIEILSIALVFPRVLPLDDPNPYVIYFFGSHLFKVFVF